MDSSAALHAHERRSLLSGMRPHGPSLNGPKTVFSWPTATKEKKGRSPFGSSLPSTAIGRTPRGSAASESAREHRNPPKRRLSEVRGTAMTEAWWPRGDQQFGSSMLGARAAVVFSSLQRAKGDEICHGNLIRPTATSEHLQGDKVRYGDFIQPTATSEGDKTNGFSLFYCNLREIRFATVDLIRPTATLEGDKFRHGSLIRPTVTPEVKYLLTESEFTGLGRLLPSISVKIRAPLEKAFFTT
ncbi:hypothetical protein CXB51_022398 [Gossypium anomalum]|uniref:Uncharacterized protein n=1 Tax=Gossypium anomalum TaxID=47600 RepID=A0A8J6CQD1_9ROSI|nr:hypothetical protein CXB51_022398 [Gossypium anomalum]